MTTIIVDANHPSPPARSIADGNVVDVQSGGVIEEPFVYNGGLLQLDNGAYADTVVVEFGKVLIDGNATANLVELAGGTIELASPDAKITDVAGPDVTPALVFGFGYHSNLQIDVPQSSGTTFSVPIYDFQGGDDIDLKYISYAGATITTTPNGEDMTVTVANGSASETFDFTGPYASELELAPDAQSTPGAEIVVACFASGTLIRTVRGDIAVEDLRVGDFAITASGEHRSIRWIGHRKTDCRRYPSSTRPIRISAHAFGENLPARNLYVSPGHAICVDVLGEMLIPAASLVNGSTIQQVAVDELTYWHVELDGHDVILAENLPVESYLEMGNRGFFTEAGVISLAALPDSSVRMHADFCRPYVISGPVCAVIRAQLAGRAALLEIDQRQTAA